MNNKEVCKRQLILLEMIDTLVEKKIKNIAPKNNNKSSKISMSNMV